MAVTSIRSAHRSAPILISGGLVAVLIASCGPSKVAQCNSFVEVVNKEQALSDEFFAAQQELGGAQDEDSILSLATAAKDYSQQVGGIVEEVAALDLEDETVVDLQQRYVEQQTQLQEGIVETANAMEQIGSGQVTTPEQLQAIEQQMNAATTKVTEAEQQIETIQTDYTAYCVDG
ncbi:MAG: hypothetical protein ACFBSF_11480 [Leptolyngbyaceae cyanobacterium]